MIKNIKVIKNVGVFQNYEMRLTGLEADFSMNNFIFGLNTYGKSTLCDILKDANENTVGRIKDRKTIPSSVDTQKIVISCSNGTVSLDNDNWKNNSLCNNILVFDTEFVFNNVFDGTELTEDRTTKENFTEFILGEKGVEKIQEIEQLKKTLKIKKEQLKFEVPFSHTDCSDSEIKKYVKASAKSSDEIEKIKSELEKLKSQNELLTKRKERLSEIQEFSIITLYEDKVAKIKADYETVEKILVETYELPNGAIETYKKHISEHFTSNKEGEAWIAKGIKITKDSSICPFCGQSTSVSSVMPLYNSIFDKYYIEYVSTIIQKLSKIDIVWDVCSLYEKLSEVLMHIQKSKAFSANLFDEEINEIEPMLIIIKDLEKELKEKLDFYRTEFNGAIGMKKTFPTFKISLNKDEFFDLFIEYSSYISIVNDIIIRINKKIETLKKQSNLQQIEESLEKSNQKAKNYQHFITRFEENDRCEKWQSLYNEIDSLSKRIKELTMELGTEQKQYLDSYFESIDEYFKIFGGRDFRIERGDLNNRGYKQVQGIKVLFRNKPITKINHIFSESDKRALALAVFIAKIRNLPDDVKSKKIVIFDDPITSFDENRMTSVIMIIDELSSSVSQTFMFGHHYGFAYETSRRCRNNFLFFEIRNENNNSGIFGFDTEMSFSNDVIKSYLKMKRFVDGDSNEVTENEMRIFLEEYLKIVFAQSYKDNKLEEKKFGECIDELHKLGAISNSAKDVLHRFRVNLNPESHTFKRSTIEDNRTLAGQILDFLFEKINLK